MKEITMTLSVDDACVILGALQLQSRIQSYGSPPYKRGVQIATILENAIDEASNTPPVQIVAEKVAGNHQSGSGV